MGARAKALRDAIFHFVEERLLAGEPPTVREVQLAFGFRAVESARFHLEALVREGRLGKDQGKSRGYRLPAAPGGSSRFCRCPSWAGSRPGP